MLEVVHGTFIEQDCVLRYNPNMLLIRFNLPSRIPFDQGPELSRPPSSRQEELGQQANASELCSVPADAFLECESGAQAGRGSSTWVRSVLTEELRLSTFSSGFVTRSGRAWV